MNSTSKSPMRVRLPFWVAKVSILVYCWGAPVAAQQQAESAQDPIVVGVVRDGAPAGNDIVPLIEAELAKHLPSGSTVTFKEDPAFNAEWDSAQVPAALRAALEDPDVDIVLVDELYATLEAAREGFELAKPVVSAFLQRSDVFRLPLGDGDRSTKNNLIFTVSSHGVEGDLRSFRKLVGFESLTVLLSAEDMELVPGLASRLESFEQQLGIDIRFSTASEDVSDFLSGLGGADAVYLTRLPRLSLDEKRELVDALAERGLPSFSLAGVPDVELGALATLTPDTTRPLVRRVALNIARLIRGDPIDELPVLLSIEPRLTINGRTSAAIGFKPNWRTRLYANFVQEDALDEQGAETLVLSDAYDQAATSNTFLSIQDEVVESVRQNRALARSALLPQALVNVRYRHANVDGVLRAIFPENSSFLGLSIRQMIFDDQAIANYRASLHISEGSELRREADRLRVLGDTGVSFFGLALTQALYRVDVDNLRLTESFLELARLRREVGYSGQDEILRWESAVAQSRASLLASSEAVEAARITLNRVLGVEQTRRWLPQTAAVDPEVFPFLRGRLSSSFDDLEALDSLRDAFVRVAIQNAPEIMAIDKELEAIDLRVGSVRRSFYLPRAFLDFSYDRKLSGDAGNLPSDGSNLGFLTLGAEYPLFAGGRRLADLRKVEVDRRVIDRQRAFTEELIEQETRIAFRRTESSFPRIGFARQAADAARQNLTIVQDKYSEGIADVTALISAQNERLTAEQLAAAATYEFLIDLVELQRSLSWFEDEKTASEGDSLYREVSALQARPEQQ